MLKEVIEKAVQCVGSKQILAKKVGVSYKTVLDWASGRSGVSITNALKIEKVTEGKVKASDILPPRPWEELR